MFGNGPNNGFRVHPRSIQDIRLAANVVRNLIVSPQDRIIDVESLLERLPEFGISPEIVEDDYLPPGVEACYYPEHLTIYLTEATYGAIRRSSPRARFTVIHELGHAVLGHTRSFNREQGRPAKTYEDSEWQANQFAAEILMPLAAIRKMSLPTAESLAQTFGVSMQAAETRITKLKDRREI